MVEERSIFDEAGKKKVGKGKSEPIPTSTEVDAMLEKMRKMKADLEKKLSDLYEKGRLHNIDVEKIMTNPANFSQEEWEIIHRNKELFAAQVDSVLTPALGKKKKSQTTLTKERKGKTLGARRKWMPMR